MAVGPDVFERRTQSSKEPKPEMAWRCSRERLQPYETLEDFVIQVVFNLLLFAVERT